ncbi:hypothetical protein LOK49_LG05G03132 [Camellia lanceoleosa]|uniref:Uncharacterized protein n=1 Tax=Camellia lanceoleosa TaxID=1840588 RepID=A0ACC0HSJ0_9ERIC|nr:hypothetical protein LOK49_LG05G03132 [Camellia lanceoleosa]
MPSLWICWEGLELIPSENFTSVSIMQAVGSFTVNKCNEGYPGPHDLQNDLHYSYICFFFSISLTCDPDHFGSLSGSPANFQVYIALLKPYERIMALDLPYGGHLSHGYQTDTKKIYAVSIFFETMAYRLDESTGYIDYDQLEKNATLFRPKLIVAGVSAYAHLYDYARIQKKAVLLADIAHISGLVAAGVIPSPFEFADIVTTTTHESLHGPRRAMIFFKKGVKEINKQGQEVMFDYEDKINQAVFPGLQGGPHNHTISGLAVALKQAMTSEYKAYQVQVLSNCSKFAETVSSRTDNHLVLVNLRNMVLLALELRRFWNQCTLQNTVPRDVSAMVLGGNRTGKALFLRSFCMNKVEGLKEFVSTMKSDAYIAKLCHEVEEYAKQFPTIGFEKETMKYNN